MAEQLVKVVLSPALLMHLLLFRGMVSCKVGAVLCMDSENELVNWHDLAFVQVALNRLQLENESGFWRHWRI